MAGWAISAKETPPPKPVVAAAAAPLVAAPVPVQVAAPQPAPIAEPAWTTFVQEVRDAGLKAYAAAQAKDQNKMIDLSETVSAACAHCHRKWRDRKTPANRCK